MEKFSIVKKGYNQTEVDEYIATLEEVIKGYKDKDAAIKNAIINAQVAADNIIQNAKNRSYEIKESSIKQIKEISASIAEQRGKLKEFQNEYNAQIEKYLVKFNNEDIAAISKKIDELEKYLNTYTNETAKEEKNGKK